MGNFLTDYWQQLIVVVLIIIAFTRLEVNVEILKQKVKTLFELWNQKQD